MKRKATAIWQGTGKDGKGFLNGPSGVLDNTPYNFKARFENEDGKAGTNPEELIAAAHAGCFAMALSFAIQDAGFEANKLDVDATITVEQQDGGFAFTHIQLDLTGKVDGMDEAKFKELAEGAKKGCPVSKALSSVDISLNTTFES